MKLFRARTGLGLTLLAGLGAVSLLLVRQGSAGTAGQPGPNREAIERTRATIQMLDDLHKAYIVNITQTYVKARELTPAARVAKKVFRHMAEKGYSSGRLIDATGEPLNEANVAKTDFEKRAVARMKAGKTYYEEIGTKDGKPVLRAATIVPVVMKQCAVCHPGHKQGDLLGALTYEVPIR